MLVGPSKAPFDPTGDRKLMMALERFVTSFVVK